MSGSPVAVTIPDSVFEDACRHARETFPAECCGWLSGDRDGARVDELRRCDNVQADGDHPTAADRGEDRAYVIAGADLLALNKTLDSDRPARIIYHSHPNGRAYLSKTDREVATSPWGDGPTYPVQQLVIGIDERRVVEAALFAWSDDSGEFVEIARYPGIGI